jgi:hypothetical protein
MPRSAQAEVIAALALANPCRIDLWKFELPQGTQRWAMHPVDIILGADTWAHTSPVIGHGAVRMTSGTEVATLDVDLKGRFLIGGIPIAALAATGSFDDVRVTFDRLYLPDWTTTPTTNHRLRLFLGDVYEPKPASTTTQLVVKGVLAKAEDEIPRRQVGPMCPWTWGDSLTANRCGIVRASYQASDTINATGTTTQSIVLVTGSSAYLVKGATLTFSDGQQRVIQSWTAGTKTAVIDSPLAAIPSGSVTIHRGCDKTLSATTGCGYYANLVRFGGFPAVPVRN